MIVKLKNQRMYYQLEKCSGWWSFSVLLTNVCTFRFLIMLMSLFRSVFQFSIPIQVYFYVFLSSSLVIMMLFSSYHCYCWITCTSSFLKKDISFYFYIISTCWSFYHLHQYKLWELNFFLPEIILSYWIKSIWYWFGFLLLNKFFRNRIISAIKD